MLERYDQDCTDYLFNSLEGDRQMLDNADTPADRKADLQGQIARLDRKIEEVKPEIACWQDELDDLEFRRAALLDELDEPEGDDNS